MKEKTIKVKCISNLGFENILKDNKIYTVMKELNNRYNLQETGEAYEFSKDRFEEVEEKKEYSVMELLDFPVGAKFKDEFEDIIEVSKADEEETEKELRINGDMNCTLRLTTAWRRMKFTKVEEPKPVSFIEAFKAYEEGKIIESLISGDRYKKGENHMLIKKQDKEYFVNCRSVWTIELEGQWIIL